MKFITIILFAVLPQICFSQIYSTVNGQIYFISDAPLEVIEASSSQLHGILDMEHKTFAFKIFIKSFDGFNSPLQKIHFAENYLETSSFPIATFKGKILEKVELGKDNYRAKGLLLIHGIEVERIIDVRLNVEKKTIEFDAIFNVPLADHDIELPRIVYQKIAEEIFVTVNGKMQLKE